MWVGPGQWGRMKWKTWRTGKRNKRQKGVANQLHPYMMESPVWEHQFMRECPTLAFVTAFSLITNICSNVTQRRLNLPKHSMRVLEVHTSNISKSFLRTTISCIWWRRRRNSKCLWKRRTKMSFSCIRSEFQSPQSWWMEWYLCETSECTCTGLQWQWFWRISLRLIWTNRKWRFLWEIFIEKSERVERRKKNKRFLS